MSTTSANPDDLDQFVTQARPRRIDIQTRLGDLVSLENTVLAGCIDFLVPRGPTITVEANMPAWEQNETFVETVRDELLGADRNADGTATISDADVAVALTAAGVASPPPVVEVEPPVLLGIPPTSGFADDPICVANGNFVHVEVDLDFPGWTAVLDVQRVYNSMAAHTMGAFGPGWSSTLDLRIDHVEGGPVRARLGDGAVVPFVDGGRDGRLRAEGTRPLELAVLDQGWILHEGNTKQWRFDADGEFIGGTAGATTLVVRREGGRIVELAEERSGRWVRFEWLGMRVHQAISSDGRVATYHYDDGGRLVEVDRPKGRVTYGLDDSLIASVTDADGVRLALNVYDDDGRVIEQTNEFGRTTRYEYSELGTTLVTDTVHGPRNAFSHDKRGNLTALVDGRGRGMRLTYDDDGRVTQVIDRDGARRRFSYDDRGNLAQRIDPDGLFAAWEWDKLDRLVAETHRNRAATSYEYEGTSRRPSRITDPAGGTYLIELDDDQLPARVTDPDGVVTRYEWNDDGLMTAMVDVLGNRTEVSYDAAGRPAGTVDGSGVVTELVNDAGGRLLEAVIGGSGPSFTYTEAGRPLAGTDPTGLAWSATYGPNGKIDTFVDGADSEMRYEWDVFGNLATVVAPDGARFGHRYDETGALVAVTDPEGRESVTAHDPEGRPIRLTDAAGRVWSRELDPLGRTTALITPDGGRTEYLYHHDGQIARVRHPDGTTVSTEIDTLGRIIAVVDETNRRYQFVHSPAGRLLERHWPSGRTEQFTYDEAGRLVGAETVGRADAVTLTLDGSGRTIAADGPDGRVEYQYDAAGELVDVQGPVGAVSLERDAGGWVRGVARTDGSHTSYQLDARGLVSEATDPAGLVTRFAHDVRGRVESVTAPSGETRAFGYDATGYLERVTDPTGTMRRILDPTGVAVGHRFDDGTGVDRTLDPMGRVTSVNDAGGDQLASFDWDPRGRLLQAHSPTSDVTTRFERDPAGRLLAVDGPHGRQSIDRDLDGYLTGWSTSDSRVEVGRDDAGRIDRLVDSDAGQVSRPPRRGIDRDRAGRLLATNDGATFRYDSAGRLVESISPDGQSWTFTYGDAGLLVSEAGPAGTVSYRRGFLGRIDAVTRPDGSTTEYFYDGTGRRVGATSSDGSSVQWFWNALDQLFAIERRRPDGSTERIDVDHDALGRPVRVDGTPVAWDDAFSGLPSLVGDRRYLHLSGRSMPAEPGADWAAPTADPWGHEPDAPDAPHVGMHGHLAAAGLVWMGARVYDPSTREFLTPDPLAAVVDRNGSASVYTYGWLDPVNFADPSGLQPISQADFDAIRAREEQGRLGQAWEAIKEDPWGTVAMVGVTAVGVGLMFVPGGQVVGAGILIGVASSAGMGLATGNFSPRSSAVGGVFGAIPGGSTLRGAVLVGAATGAGEELAIQVVNGQPINPMAALAAGGTGGLMSGGGRLIGDHISGTTAHIDEPAPPTTSATPSQQTTILGENMTDRVIPFAERTDARHLPFGATAEEWDAMTPRERYRLNDGALRARINEGDNFRYIGQDPARPAEVRARFDLTRSELLRLQERGIPYETVSPDEVAKILGQSP